MTMDIFVKIKKGGILKRIIYLLTISFLFIQACSENSTGPVPDKAYGVGGTVLDTAGVPVSGVQVYCLFDYGYIPDTTGININKGLTVTDSTFGNELWQNFPNPLSKDTYMRFSLGEESVVNLSISSKLNGRNIYQEVDTLQYGLYQKYFGELGNNADFKNGPYEASLTITTLNDSVYEFKKEMFIISDRNEPASVSSDRGKYIFNYNEAFINDTVKECSIFYPDQIHYHVISNNIILQFKKDGYITKYVPYTLYAGVMFNQDVILEKGAEQ